MVFEHKCKIVTIDRRIWSFFTEEWHVDLIPMLMLKNTKDISAHVSEVSQLVLCVYPLSVLKTENAMRPCIAFYMYYPTNKFTAKKGFILKLCKILKLNLESRNVATICNPRITWTRNNTLFFISAYSAKNQPIIFKYPRSSWKTIAAVWQHLVFKWSSLQTCPIPRPSRTCSDSVMLLISQGD